MHPSCLRRFASAALVVLAGLVAGTGANAQGNAFTVRGTVVDAATQRPLPNATVRLRGTQAQTTTNAQGEYTLSARVQPGTYTLEYSLIGRGDATRQVAFGASPTVQVAPVGLAESAVALQEIVVTGTGVPTERRAVPNAVSTVRGEAINEAPGAPSIDAALQGKVAGAVITQNNGQPGGGVSIRLRGTSSILGGAEPLIVIDGVIVDNNAGALISLGANASRGDAALSNRLSDIAPADIDRVEILKGAAAAALYGSRANAGVIQIFTKRGQQGAPRINARTELTSSNAPRRYALNESPIASRGDVLFGGASAIGAQVQRFNYQDQIFRTGNGFNNQISVSGGSEGTTYYLSGNWMGEQGIVRGSDHSNINARAKVGQRIASWLEVTANANYIQRTTNYVREGEQADGGVLTALIFTPTSWNPAFDPSLGRFPYNPLIGTNPLDVIQNWRAEQNVNRFVGSFGALLTPLPKLTVNYLFGLDNGTEEFVSYQPPRSTSANFTGLIQNPVRDARRFNNDLTANYDLDLNPAVQLSTTVGFRQTSDRYNEVRAATGNLPPGQITLGGATQFASQGLTELRTLSGFVQERVSLNDRLFLTAGLNADASSAFGEEERWQLFPRLGASYVVSDEPFWTNSAIGNTVSRLRLRAAYGQTGGQPPGAYVRLDNYNNVARGGLAGLTPSAIAGNPGLRPERQREYEGGFDIGFFNDRALVEVTAYDQRTSDLVLQAPLALSSGYSTQFQNVGVLSNRGIEVSLNTANVQRSNFGWNSRLIYSTNREEVKELVGQADTLAFGGYSLHYVMVGQPVGVFYAAHYPRDAQGNVIMAGRRDARGFLIPGTAGFPTRARGFNPATNDSTIILRKILGSPVPDFTASLGNDFTFGQNLQLSFLLDGRFGNEVANFSRRISQFFGADRESSEEACQLNPTTGAVIACPRTLNLDRHLLYEEFVEDGSFVKLREVALQYQINPDWARRVGAGSLSLRVAGRNLHTWTRYSGIDPEINLFAANTVARGVDFATTPIPRTFAVGLSADF